MKTILVILFSFFILFAGCEKITEPVSDPVSIIKGIIIEAETGESIDSVIVGFKNPDTPDSILFIGDSLVTGIPNSIELQILALNGIFAFAFAYVEDPPVSISNMFAYKPGKKLWRFTSGYDSVSQVKCSVDSLAIRMIENDCYSKPDWNEITLYDHLFISFPKTYGCSEGLYFSEDTWGFLKNREDWEVSFHWELGMTPFFPKEFEYLPTASEYGCEYREIFFVENDSAGYYYYHPVNQRGIALIKNEERNKYKEIVFVDFTVKNLPEVMNILRTIRYKY